MGVAAGCCDSAALKRDARRHSCGCHPAPALPVVIALPCSLRLVAPTQHKKHKHSSKDKDRERERLLKEAKKFLKQREAPAISHQCRIAWPLD